MKNYFVYDPGNGYSRYETQDEAIVAAKKAISDCLDISEGWDDEVNDVVVGIITHRATKTNIATKVGEVDEDGYDESGQEWLSEFDETCDYELSEVNS